MFWIVFWTIFTYLVVRHFIKLVVRVWGWSTEPKPPGVTREVHSGQGTGDTGGGYNQGESPEPGNVVDLFSVPGRSRDYGRESDHWTVRESQRQKLVYSQIRHPHRNR